MGVSGSLLGILGGIKGVKGGPRVLRGSPGFHGVHGVSRTMRFRGVSGGSRDFNDVPRDLKCVLEGLRSFQRGTYRFQQCLRGPRDVLGGLSGFQGIPWICRGFHEVSGCFILLNRS